MRHLAIAGSFVVIAALGVGCSSYSNKSPMPSISDSSRANLNAPVNCATADKDIATLEEEKASVGKQILSGVRSIMPIAAVVGLLMGDYTDRVEVATGEYNEDLSMKIKQIKATCGIN